MAAPAGRNPKIASRHAALAQQMYDEHDADGTRRYSVAQIAAKFGVTCPIIYRHLDKTATTARTR